jgi:hypothetical protein
MFELINATIKYVMAPLEVGPEFAQEGRKYPSLPATA